MHVRVGGEAERGHAVRDGDAERQPPAPGKQTLAMAVAPSAGPSAPVQRKTDAASPPAGAGDHPPSQGRAIQQLFGRPGAGDTKAPADAEGAPPAHLRASVERATGTALDDVRVHEGPGA